MTEICFKLVLEHLKSKPPEKHKQAGIAATALQRWHFNFNVLVSSLSKMMTMQFLHAHVLNKAGFCPLVLQRCTTVTLICINYERKHPNLCTGITFNMDFPLGWMGLKQPEWDPATGEEGRMT